MRKLDLATVVVDDYDTAISFYCDILGFRLTDDTPLGGGKRWVVVRPDADGAGLLLAKANKPDEQNAIGKQTGGRVGFFLNTDDFGRDYALYRSLGVIFNEEPRHEPYGTVAVFRDIYGNLWDLIEKKA
jgi:catechol 2,3-dioxygenase-like lactoylglutathione lyase family enzyme